MARWPLPLRGRHGPRRRCCHSWLLPLASFLLLACLVPVAGGDSADRDVDALVKRAEELRGGTASDRATAAHLLRSALQLEPDHPPALYVLGDMYALSQLRPDPPTIPGPSAGGALAAALWLTAAGRGHAPSQAALGLAYAIGPVVGVPKDAPRSLLYLFFAAGSPVADHAAPAQLALGYRSLHGLNGSPVSCATAALYYQPPAAEAAARAAAPSAVSVHERPHRLAIGRRPRPHAQAHDLLNWVEYSASAGSAEAAVTAGHLLAGGLKGLPTDSAAARRYLERAAAGGSSEALAQLGHARATGALGLSQDNVTAVALLSKAAAAGSAHGAYGLAIMQLGGFGVARDDAAAVALLTKAAEAGSPGAHHLLGSVRLGGRGGLPPDAAAAAGHFASAAAAGSLPAQYQLGVMHLSGHGVPTNCRAGVAMLKAAAERDGPVSAEAEAAAAAYAAGRTAEAVVRYLRAAEMGSEPAAANAAYLLRGGHGIPKSNTTAAAALLYHQRAADQGNVEALVASGDAVYAGVGAPADPGAAAAAYARAAALGSGQAAFNLGLMHESGTGLPRDWHLAKRYYDLAAEQGGSAPAALALAKLDLRRRWAVAAPRWRAAWVASLEHADLAAAGGLAAVLVLAACEWRRRALERPAP